MLFSSGCSRKRSGHASSPTAKSAASARQPRRIYPYSLIAGGVADEQEFAAIRAADSVVGAHYRDVGMKLWRRALDDDERMYSSYRIGTSVYWTRHPVVLHRGETVLTDGKNMVRGRCGNRLSKTPQEPTRFVEPPAVSDDTPAAVQMVGDAPEVPQSEMNAFDAPAELPDAPQTDSQPNKPPPPKPGKKTGETGPMVLAPGTTFWPAAQPVYTPVTAPEPGTWVLMAAGLAGVGLKLRRSRRNHRM